MKNICVFASSSNNLSEEFYKDALANAEEWRYTTKWDTAKVDFPKRWERLIGKERVNATLDKSERSTLISSIASITDYNTVLVGYSFNKDAK